MQSYLKVSLLTLVVCSAVAFKDGFSKNVEPYDGSNRPNSTLWDDAKNASDQQLDGFKAKYNSSLLRIIMVPSLNRSIEYLMNNTTLLDTFEKGKNQLKSVASSFIDFINDKIKLAMSGILKQADEPDTTTAKPEELEENEDDYFETTSHS
jgi:hypothetical protein